MGISVLELLHPDGRATTSFVLGSNWTESLSPEPQIESDQKVALLILAPSAEECRSECWLDQAVKFIDRHLSDDGVCYVLVPLPWRLKVIKLLSRANLVIDSSFWHFPNLASSQYLVPLQRGPAQFFVEKIISLPSWKRTLAKEVFRYSITRKFLAAFGKSSGISVRRPSARPLFQWIFKTPGEDFVPGTAIVRKSWRGRHGASILYCFPEPNSLPSAIAKVTLLDNSSSCPEGEVEALEALGPGVRRAGVQIPQILRGEHDDQRWLLFLSPIHGKPASDLLESNPGLLSPILTNITDWLKRWHLATVIVRPLPIEQIEQALLAPLERLSPFLEGADRYRDWLANQSKLAAGDPMPFVAAHNDLTMANILLDKHNISGVVDWETAQTEGWPLVDFHYAVTDAVRIAASCPGWLEAFKACYHSQGAYAPKIASLQKQMETDIGISAGVAELCFHVCWLHHASNEHRVSQPGDPRPFLQIVQWLAANYSKRDENKLSMHGENVV